MEGLLESPLFYRFFVKGPDQPPPARPVQRRLYRRPPSVGRRSFGRRLVVWAVGRRRLEDSPETRRTGVCCCVGFLFGYGSRGPPGGRKLERTSQIVSVSQEIVIHEGIRSFSHNSRPPSPPTPCVSGAKGRKTTVARGGGAQTRSCVRATHNMTKRALFLRINLQTDACMSHGAPSTRYQDLLPKRRCSNGQPIRLFPSTIGTRPRHLQATADHYRGRRGGSLGSFH